MVGERIYLRFVPVEAASEIECELGTCLRLLECSEGTPRVLSLEMAAAAYPAWERARRSIFEAWTLETDPANLQPRLAGLNQEVAEFLREHPPADVGSERFHRCLDAIESPWSKREERVLREAYEREYASHEDKARALVGVVEQVGAEPFHPPEPLPPIDMGEVHLITWMAIERGPSSRS